MELADPGFRELVERKVRIPGTEPPDLSPARIGQLRRQMQTQLRPMLRNADYVAFDLDVALAAARELAVSLGLLKTYRGS